MAIELNDDLLALQRAADAHAQLKALSERYGRPTQVGGWTNEQHQTWDAALDAWRERAADVQAAVADHAAATGQDRAQLEAATKKAVRHTEPGE
ncbi:hypothetical protein [Streptomyces sp. NBC_01264]|uniref:hypothetical protein n=1 Tax=Streptomyces sp. NBC_01264 TaxID=2903804 RepID=UPI0022520E7C|nr:hypothetical protein [Streptomyces sp. NBC_01264]MCX4784347.1 hypothetical protein [Streptomyces sp. NBC_01264]